MGMDYLGAIAAIEKIAEKEGVSVNEVIREIDLAIEEAMQNPDPLVQARWTLIPCAGDKPTAIEFIAYMRGKIHSRN